MNERRILGIIGTGLIGASIGLRARSGGWRVLGFDRDSGAAQEAHALGAIDEIANRDHVYASANVIAISVPPAATIAELAELHSMQCVAELIIDVASVKEPIVHAGSGVRAFVATHPLAGSEAHGPRAAQGDLFEGKPWLYVAPADPALERRAVDFVGAMGAHAIAVEPQEHDRILALSSHLPQLMATLFTKTLRHAGQARNAPAEDFCGPVARELLRIGDSPAELWREIFSYNRENVAQSAREFAAQLNAAARALMHETEREEDQTDEHRADRDDEKPARSHQRGN